MTPRDVKNYIDYKKITKLAGMTCHLINKAVWPRPWQML